ncbi:hypothetical protein [Chitinimonas sp.]|uniref:hypothetical protein n=1 Tax=Chitinimonas sp. TaxID=1934313 RepID=UPI002F91E90B
MNMRAASPGGLPADQAVDETLPQAPPAMAAIGRIDADPPYGYTALRERGIALTQGLSGNDWTDYNHHDPGVTLLEVLCYALTEGVFGAELPVADLLAEPSGEIHYRRHGLHAAEEILPCRPTTELDQLRWILDRVPQIRHLRMTMQLGRSELPNGLWQMAVRAPARVGEAAASAAARAYWSQRNLGEDLARAPRVLAPRWCSLRIALSIGGARELTDILAELVQRCSDLISAAPPRTPRQVRLAELDATGQPLPPSELFDGPPLKFGWIASSDLERDPANRLFFSDLILALQQIEGVEEIRYLSLAAEGLAASEGALPWHGPDWALQLRWPDTPELLDGWTVTRRGSTLSIDREALLQRLRDELLANQVIPQDIVRVGSAAAEMLARPSGHPTPEAVYHAAFNHLPPIYRGAELTERSSAQQKLDATGRAQFTAYQALLEQWLAHGEAQLQHLRKLYTIEAAPVQSYWWDLLGSEHLPGLGGLYKQGEAGMARCLDVFQAADEVLARRSRVLDHLLALHGESCAQSSIQSFGWYYGPGQWQQHLFECKRQLLLRIVRHTRDRAGGFDYSRPSLGRKGNTAALQERVGLLLGMVAPHSRSLLAPLARWGIRLAAETQTPTASGRREASGAPLAMWSPLRRKIAAQYADDVAQGRVARRLAHYFPGLDLAALSPALLRAATHADRYRLGKDGQHATLWLGEQEAGPNWPLRLHLAQGAAEGPAMYLHEFACEVQRECEGLHLVEHILLRPLGDAGTETGNLPPYFLHQITVVFAGWTARGTDPAFRHLAEETLALGCPAHLLPHVLWLDVPTLARFEPAFEAWLLARQDYCEALALGAGHDRTVIARLDAHAATLREILVAAQVAAQAGGGQ